MIDEKVMKLLRNYIGKKVTVEYVSYGSSDVERDVIKEVNDFSNITIGCSGIPFVGYGSAIRKIVDENKKTLYENPLISPTYDARKDEDIDKVRAASFGYKIAHSFREQRETEKKKWEEEKAKLDKQAQGKTKSFQEFSRDLIKSELFEEWNKYVATNTKDFYSAGVVEASLKVMKALSEGKSPKEAEKTVYDLGITGFQMGCVAQTVSHYHPRGEEFRLYWNRQYLPKDKAEKAKGVVNPAIWTIG